MKNLTTITKNIEKMLGHKIANEKYYSVENFISDSKEYIKAIKEGRMVCNIDKVSNSGMSRTIKFLSCNGSKGKFHYRNYWVFFKVMGFSAVKDSHYFRLNGCGMDMIFDTNYRNIRFLGSLGFLNKKQVEILCQKTPSII
jgi:hypothetical protein